MKSKVTVTLFKKDSGTLYTTETYLTQLDVWDRDELVKEAIAKGTNLCNYSFTLKVESIQSVSYISNTYLILN